MSIRLEFINVIIPIVNIKRCLGEDGFNKFLKEEEKWIGKTIWFDSHLYREGAMNIMDIDMMIKRWDRRGLNLFKYENSIKMWDELCVVDSAKGLNLACEWIKLNLNDLEAEYIR